MCQLHWAGAGCFPLVDYDEPCFFIFLEEQGFLLEQGFFIFIPLDEQLPFIELEFFIFIDCFDEHGPLEVEACATMPPAARLIRPPLAKAISAF